MRARSLAVLTILLGGALAIVSSTQTWLEVTLRSDHTEPLSVAGADTVALLAPLSLAALALGLALTIAGRVLRYVFGVLALAIGAVLVVASLRIGVGHPLDAAAAAVTEATGLAGESAITALVASIVVTVWPFVATAAGAVIAAGGVLTLAGSHRWKTGGKRYRTDTAPSAPDGSRPYDAIDSWDELSRGEDPTSR